MSAKFLVLGDLHWRATSPIARTDDFKAALAAKLRECWELARTHNVDAILQTGDVFDSPNIAYSTLAELWQELKAAPVPIITVAGNHDLFGAHPGSLYRTPLGFLFQMGSLADAEEVWVFIESNVRLTGRCFDASIDEDPADSYGYQAKKEPGCVHITLSHGLLVERPLPARHTLLSDLARIPEDQAAEIVVNGHFHLPVGIRRVGKTLVIAPGALCRMTAAVEEIERPVQVALLEIEGQDYDAKLIPLKSARPGHEVLSRAHLEAAAEREQRKAQFLDLLTLEQTQRVMDLVDMVSDIARREQVSEEIRDEALLGSDGRRRR